MDNNNLDRKKNLLMMKLLKAFRKYCSEQATCLTSLSRVDVIARRFFLLDFFNTQQLIQYS